MLKDLVEADSFILDFDDPDYVISANVYEKLKRKCLRNWETYMQVQERA